MSDNRKNGGLNAYLDTPCGLSTMHFARIVMWFVFAIIGWTYLNVYKDIHHIIGIEFSSMCYVTIPQRFHE